MTSPVPEPQPVPGDPYSQAASAAAAGGNGSTVKNVVLLPTGERQWYYSAGHGGYVNQEQPLTEQQAQAYYLRMTPSERKKLDGYYKQVGGPLGFRSAKSMWAAFVTASVNTDMTPWEILAAQSAQPLPPSTSTAGGSAGSAGPYLGPTTTTTVANEMDAKSLVNNALSQYLGRTATDAEVSAFHQKLNSELAANPNVSDPTSQHAGVNSGGTNPQQLAEDFAKSQPDYAETQAATTGLNWMVEAIRKGTGAGRMI